METSFKAEGTSEDPTASGLPPNHLILQEKHSANIMHLFGRWSALSVPDPPQWIYAFDFLGGGRKK